MMELIFASHNDHKVKEIQQIINPEIYRILSLGQINYHEDIVEDGLTMKENALIKARTIFQLKAAPVFSEDSGLEITALDMQPGIYTARYAGPQRDDNQNMSKVLAELKSKKDRSARFRACIAYIDSRGNESVFEGRINGRIAFEKKGKDGFGYDPIFIPEGFDQTFAQLSNEIKLTHSHRTKALKKLLTHLNQTK